MLAVHTRVLNPSARGALTDNPYQRLVEAIIVFLYHHDLRSASITNPLLGHSGFIPHPPSFAYPTDSQVSGAEKGQIRRELEK
jgi:hypothetical protein